MTGAAVIGALPVCSEVCGIGCSSGVKCDSGEPYLLVFAWSEFRKGFAMLSRAGRVCKIASRNRTSSYSVPSAPHPGNVLPEGAQKSVIIAHLVYSEAVKR